MDAGGPTCHSPDVSLVRAAVAVSERSSTARTVWTRLSLDPERRQLVDEPLPGEATVSHDVSEDGVTFTSALFEQETENTGPAAARRRRTGACRSAAACP